MGSRSQVGVVVATAIAASHTVAIADPRPSLDEFYERTRDREDGFDACIGYCDGTYLAGFLVGAQTASPSTDAMTPGLASGGRLGVELGARARRRPSVIRTRLWADVLRTHADGRWITDLAGQVTAFTILGDAAARRDAPELHVAFDGVAARRTELRLAEVARLQRAPYQLADVELELAPVGPRVDKDARLALPVGVAHRVRAPLAGGPLDHRTSVSGALALRGFAKQLRTHAQLDVLRVKQTWWSVPGGRAAATTISAGYQRLPLGLDTLPLWALVGYQWAGERDGLVVQVGMELPLETAAGTLELGPAFERHLELDPATATFRRVTSGRFAVRHRVGPVRWGVAYEAADVEDERAVHAITPELAVAWRGFEVGLQHRFTVVRDAAAAPAMAGPPPRDRFSLALDRRF